MLSFLKNPMNLKSGRYTLSKKGLVQTPYGWEKRASAWSDFRSGAKKDALVTFIKMMKL